MTWSEYVAFTATTALPVAASVEYLKLGVLEEACEAIAACATMQAALNGRAKRRLRGDPPEVLEKKSQAACAAQQQLIEELGDLSWYVARMAPDSKLTHTFAGTFQDVAASYAEFEYDPTPARALQLLSDMFSMTCISPESVFSANVQKLTARKTAGTIQGEGKR